jgi:hypothetical protein
MKVLLWTFFFLSIFRNTIEKISFIGRESNFRSLETETEPNESEKKDNLTILETAREKCSITNCPKKRGECDVDNNCSCFPNYITIEDEKYPFSCNYELKKQLNAFILEFFIGFGIGHLYVGNTQIASIKLVSYFTMYFILCFFPYCAFQSKMNFFKSMVPFLQTISLLTIVFWQIKDSIWFGLNYYTDGNGIVLQHW